MVRKCALCGKEFEIIDRSKNPQKYCSNECSSTMRQIKIKEYRARYKKQAYRKPKELPINSTTQIEVKISFPSWVTKRIGENEQCTM